MEKITTWSPDTCGCVIEYAWDSDDPAETRVHTAHSHDDSGCDRHNHPGTPEAFATVLEENQRKNRALDAIAQWAQNAAPHLVHTDDKGSTAVPADRHSFTYENGVLVFTLPDLTPAQKHAAAAATVHLGAAIEVR